MQFDVNIEPDDDPKICLGYLSGVFGVQGWVKVFSYTDPKENILCYSPWLLIKQERTLESEVVAGNLYGKAIVAKLDVVDSREDAASITGMNIYVKRSCLPVLEKDQFYWSDLLGLSVLTDAGEVLGRVDSLIETGANDVLVVQGDRERLIPFVLESVVKKVDLENGIIKVSWESDF